tara:strand:- start:1905 stop:2207 length:303 start_codon:yes stop_codon:yes gene_type:complete
MSAEIILKREQLNTVQDRAFQMIDMILEHIILGMQDKNDLTFGEIDLSPQERVLKVNDLATPRAPGLPSVLAALQEIAPSHVETIIKQYQKDLRVLGDAQ